MRFGRIFYLIVILICIIETARLWSLSPMQMAAHFNVDGDPDRFVSKAEFFWFEIQTMLVVLGVSLVPQLLFLVLPASLINLPNREYWLMEERRAETLYRLSSFGASLFGIIILTVQAAFEIAAYANLRTPIHFDSQQMLIVMIGSLIGIFGLLAWMIFSFRLPDQMNVSLS
jgi:uncharacterized membrane protein